MIVTGLTNTGKWVERTRSYEIHQWSGPSVDDGTMLPFSVAPEGNVNWKRFATLEQARAYVQAAPKLRRISVEFEAWVPVVERPRRKLDLKDPFELEPPSEADPMTCAQCDVVITEDDQGMWLDATGDDGCDSGPHSPHVVLTWDQINEWVQFELGGGSMMDSPLSRHRLEPFGIVVDVEDME